MILLAAVLECAILTLQGWAYWENPEGWIPPERDQKEWGMFLAGVERPSSAHVA
jgi:hypothetical protein